MRTLGLVSVLLCVTVSYGDLTGQNPPAGTCICVDANAVNIRDSGCGNVIGSADIGDCWTYNGAKVTCDLDGTTYEYFDLAYNSASGWLAADFLVTASESSCGVVVAPDPEHRSFFIATAWNVDWPTSSSDSTSEQQAQMINYLDRLSNMNMNAVVFQVRPAADAFYDSNLEPWSKFLTGTQGVAPNPYYDPLAYTVTEAHQRGIEVHAWLNPYRANLSPNTVGLDPSHACMTLSQYCYVYDNYMWLDPGAPEVVDHLVNVISDIVARYDVDGIHFDDYFYPYPDGTEFPDDATYSQYGGGMSRDDWRRNNVNTMIQRVYDTIRLASTTVKFSISPFGIYRPGHPDGMASPITGLDPYTAQFADTKLWLQSGWVDFFGPQLYWTIASTGQSYPVLIDYWLSWNTQDRHIYVANGVYKIADSNDWPITEIGDQIEISRDATRRSQGSLGNIMYSAQYFRDNTKGIYDYFIGTVYPTPASVPPMSWLPGIRNPAVPDVTVNGNQLVWDVDRSGITHSWAVYKKVGLQWSMLKKQPLSNNSYMVDGSGIYAVRAANRNNELSEPAVVSVIASNGKA